MTKEEIINLRRSSFLALKALYLTTLDPRYMEAVLPTQIQAAAEMHSACWREQYSRDNPSIADAVLKTLSTTIEDLYQIKKRDGDLPPAFDDVIEALEGLLLMAHDAIKGELPVRKKVGGS